MIDLDDRRRFLRELLVAEVLALPGRGPLARLKWPRIPASAVPPSAAGSEAVQEAEPER
jgi:hypothetical protein